MFYVATLISAPERPAVTDALARQAARYLPHGRPVDWLEPGVAVDIAFLLDDVEPGEETGVAERPRRRPARDHRLGARRCRASAAG